MTPLRHSIAPLFFLLMIAFAQAQFRGVDAPAPVTPAVPAPAGTAPTPPVDGAPVAPTPFQGAGTLAPTPTPPPAAPTPPPAQAEVPRVQLLGRKNPDVKGHIITDPTGAVIRRPGKPSSPDEWIYAVEGTIQAFHPPAGGYFVECFFITKPEGTSKPLAGSVTGAMVHGDFPPVAFRMTALSLASLYALPDIKYKFTGGTANDATKSPQVVDDVTKVTITQSTGIGYVGSIELPVTGWAVRIIAGGGFVTGTDPYGRPQPPIYKGGEVVYTGGSDDTLTALVHDNPGYFQKLYEVYTAPPPPAGPFSGRRPGQ